MSNAPSPLRNEQTTRLPDDPRLPESPRSDLRDGVRSALETISAPFEFAGFWAAVLLPVLYVPMLAGGFTGGERSAFALLVAAHVVALLAGHGYRND